MRETASVNGSILVGRSVVGMNIFVNQKFEVAVYNLHIFY